MIDQPGKLLKFHWSIYGLWKSSKIFKHLKRSLSIKHSYLLGVCW